MKIIIASTPIGGHLNPVLGLARILVEDGHEVVIYTGSTLRDRVAAVGARLEVLPASADFDMRDVDRCFPERAAFMGADRMLYDFGTIFFGAMAAQHDGLMSLLARFPADLIIAEQLFYGVIPLLLGDPADRPAVFGCGVSHIMLDRADGLPHGMGLPFAADEAARQHHAELFGPLGEAASGPLQALYASSLAPLGVRDDGPALSALPRLADIYLQSGVPELEYPLADMPAHLRFVGSWPSVPAACALPDWAGDLDGRQIVLVTQGTVANADFDELVVPTMRVLANREDVLVIATAGGRAVSALGERIPANARIASYLPFDWLMPQVDVMVTNGGYGTVNQALAAGVPMVVAGLTEDKLEIAARVQWAGAGIDLKTDAPDDASLRAAIDRLLATPAYHRRTRAIAASFARRDCADILRTEMAALQPAIALRVAR